jgi:hypothetical protein
MTDDFSKSFQETTMTLAAGKVAGSIYYGRSGTSSPSIMGTIYHEAGHSFLRWHFKKPIHRVVVRSDGSGCVYGSPEPTTEPPTSDSERIYRLCDCFQDVPSSSTDPLEIEIETRTILQENWEKVELIANAIYQRLPSTRFDSDQPWEISIPGKMIHMILGEVEPLNN